MQIVKPGIDLKMTRMNSRTLLAALVLPLLAASAFSERSPAQSPQERAGNGENELETRFRQFLESYRPGIQKRNRTYLQSVHPRLPEGMYDFFFDVTLDMMRYSDENAEVEPTIECQDFDICKIVYPQPNDSWAAQRFILHEGAWRWLDQ